MLLLFCTAGLYACAASSPKVPTGYKGPVAHAPVYVGGEMWTYKNGSNEIFTRRVISADDNGYVIIRERDTVRFDRDFNMVEILFPKEQAVGKKWKDLDFPLYVGKSWGYVEDATMRVTGKTSTYSAINSVIAYEDVEVPAGKFKAFKIKHERQAVGRRWSGFSFIWYSPEAEWVVKRSGMSQGWEDEYDFNLVSYEKSSELPDLVIAIMRIADFNRNGKVEQAEVVEVTARIQNVGRGEARGVSADVETGRNVFIAGGGETHFDIGSLPAGLHKDIKFSFYTNKKISKGESIPITIKVGEARPRFRVARALDLVMNEPVRQAQEIPVREVAESASALAAGLSIDVDQEIPKGIKAEKNDVAVVIGNKNYTAAGVYPVEYADRDAAIMREYLITTFGYRPENIFYENDLTYGKFIEIFGSAGNPAGRLYRLVKAMKGEVGVFIYYVGHGAPDLDSQEAYFLPIDTSPQYISTNGYSVKTFYENISKLPAKSVTVVIDACFSGTGDKGLLFTGLSPAMVKVKALYDTPKNMLLITGGAASQVSTWYPEKRHSLFTYFFLKGIRGAADANGDGVITVGEMKEYLGETVPQWAVRLKNINQTPVVMGNENEVMVRLKK